MSVFPRIMIDEFQDKPEMAHAKRLELLDISVKDLSVDNNEVAIQFVTSEIKKPISS